MIWERCDVCLFIIGWDYSIVLLIIIQKKALTDKIKSKKKKERGKKWCEFVRYTANTCRQNEHVSRTKEHRSNGRGAPLYSSFCTRTCLSTIPSILSCYIDSFFLYSLFLYRNKQKANFHKRKKIAGTTSITRATSTVVKGRIQILPTA